MLPRSHRLNTTGTIQYISKLELTTQNYSNVNPRAANETFLTFPARSLSLNDIHCRLNLTAYLQRIITLSIVKNVRGPS